MAENQSSAALKESAMCQQHGNFECPQCAAETAGHTTTEHKPDLKVIQGGKADKEVEGVIDNLREMPESEPTLTFDMAEYSEKGEKHETNEDASFIDAKNGTAGLFDGMGGHAAGNVASEIASRSIQESLAAIPKDADMESTIRLMKNAFDQANTDILDASAKNPDYQGMGATATMVKFHDGPDGRKAIIVNAGDSRVYIKRGPEIRAITRDDSLVQMLVDQGAISNDQDIAQELPEEWQKKLTKALRKNVKTVKDIRNVVMNGIGSASAEPQVFIEYIQPGDEIFLTSDGIHDPLLDGEIGSVGSAEDLVKLAKERGKDTKNLRAKDDDSTAVSIKVQEPAIELSLDDLELIDDEEGYAELSDEDIEVISEAK